MHGGYIFKVPGYEYCCYSSGDLPATYGATSVVCQVHQGLVGDRVGDADWCQGSMGCEEGDK